MAGEPESAAPDGRHLTDAVLNAFKTHRLVGLGDGAGGLCHLDFVCVRILIATPCRRGRCLVLFFFLFRYIVRFFYRTATAPIPRGIEFYRLGGHKSGIVHYLGQAGCI